MRDVFIQRCAGPLCITCASAAKTKKRKLFTAKNYSVTWFGLASECQGVLMGRGTAPCVLYIYIYIAGESAEFLKPCIEHKTGAKQMEKR